MKFILIFFAFCALSFSDIKSDLTKKIASFTVKDKSVYSAINSVQNISGLSVIIKNQNSAKMAPIINKKINLAMSNTTPEQILKQICNLSGLEYIVSPRGTIIISIKDLTPITKVYTVSHKLKSLIDPQSTNRVDQEKLEAFFKTGGVTLPPGSKIFYVPKSNKLTLTLSNDNHKKALKLLLNLNLVVQ